MDGEGGAKDWDRMRRSRIQLLMELESDIVSCEDMLLTACQYVVGLINKAKADPNSNPTYIYSWEKTLGEWQYMFMVGEFEMGLRAAVDKARHMTVECGDWYKLRGDRSYAELSTQWAEKRKEWAACL